jgi:uncharacterized membrane protein YuzA (DUF378 family)
MKYLNLGAFTALLIGGLNYLFMGLFNFDLFANLLGSNGIMSRVFYSLFGLSALILITTVIARTVLNEKREEETQKSSAK